MTVHPRVGGEHKFPALLKAKDAGSSPRGRGTPDDDEDWHKLCRFIPAWAGNTT